MEENVVSSTVANIKGIANSSGRHFNVRFSDIFRYLKKIFAVWIAVSVVAAFAVASVTAAKNYDSYQKLSALISFTYDGVEKGLDPNGNKFSVNTIKDEKIIKEVAEEMNIPKGSVDAIRRGITFEGIIPQDAISRITRYTNLFSDSSKIPTSELVAETTYYPTQYTVHFDYAETGLSGEQAAEFINSLLETYSRHFFDSYGFNKSLESSLNQFSYQDYDYAEAIDIFDTSLTKLSTYIAQVSSTDSTRFESNVTGYTFADLTDAISTIKEYDLEDLESYVTINSVTNDKETLLTYYRYTVEELQRHLAVCNETLASVNASISEYKKNNIMVFGETDEKNADITASVASKEYDELFDKKHEIQNDLSSTAQKINQYNQRIERLNASTQANSATNKEWVEQKIARLDEQMKELVEAVSLTTDDYYRTEVFPKAYNILAPASVSFLSVPKHVVKDSMGTVIVAEAFIFVLYLAVALAAAMKSEFEYVTGKSSKTPEKKGKKKKEEKESKKNK